ncbi:MAG: pyridoxamine 5'-phosphate oxidase family protein [Planctomycetota bacterium]|jgi:uncharacterized pyridoxamine 5'-phosphate oxidase family protein|nr:pyridoxamine 5'-phosphate oxidase family protein [Planctomycetota bacterium]
MRNAAVRSFFHSLVVLAVFSGGAGVRAAENPAFADWKAFLKGHPLGVFATAERDRPRTRVFQFLWIEGERVYFSTGASKDVAKQMRANPNVSFCVFDPAGNIVLSVDGPVTFVPDRADKERALSENAGIREIYKSADNPEFAILYIEPEKIYTFSFAGGKQYILER